MPELPEVETVVRTLRPQVLGCRIERVDVLRERSLHPLSLPVERLAGTRISAVRRRGKLALLDLEPPAAAAAVPVPSLLAVHLRMTGRFMVHPEGAAPLKHTRVIFHLQRPDRCRAQLFFDDVRAFGLVFAATPALLERWDFWCSLGPEPLDMGPGELGPRLRKLALLDLEPPAAAAGPSRPRCWIRPYWPVSATSTRTNPCSGPASIPGGLPESFRRRKRTVCAVPCRRCCGNPSPSAAAPSGTIVMPTAMWALSRTRSLSTVVADRPAVVAAARWKKAVSPAGPRYPVRGASTRGGGLPGERRRRSPRPGARGLLCRGGARRLDRCERGKVLFTSPAASRGAGASPGRAFRGSPQAARRKDARIREHHRTGTCQGVAGHEHDGRRVVPCGGRPVIRIRPPAKRRGREIHGRGSCGQRLQRCGAGMVQGRTGRAVSQAGGPLLWPVRGQVTRTCP